MNRLRHWRHAYGIADTELEVLMRRTRDGDGLSAGTLELEDPWLETRCISETSSAALSSQSDDVSIFTTVPVNNNK